MVEFTVHSVEGTQYVDVHLNNESFRAEAGAFCYFVGDVTIQSKLIPSFGGILRALLADERIYRPTYTGTGIVTLESSLGGFHVLDRELTGRQIKVSLCHFIGNDCSHRFTPVKD